MATVKYLGNSPSVSWHGIHFVKDAETDVPDILAAEMKPNRFFEFVGGKPQVTSILTPLLPEPPADIDPDMIEARHSGGRYYSIYRGTEELVGKLTKADAEAFNKMTVDDQDDYIAAELAKKAV